MNGATSLIGTEVLDEPDCAPAIARATLIDIARSNTLFGGRSAAWFGVRQLLVAAAPPNVTGTRTVSLLDLGAGGGDIAAFIQRRARSVGVNVIPVGLDRHREAAALCRSRGIPGVVADAWTVPLRPKSVDIVLASQVLHHFRPEAAVELLRAMAVLARLGVVVADLRRARAAAVGIWLAGLALGFHAVTRKDGVTSVRRGFTAEGLSELLLAAGLPSRVYRRPGYRLVAVWRADS